MKVRKNLFLLLLSLSVATVSCGSGSEGNPTVRLSLTRVPSQSFVDVQGIGFTPNQNVTSHLRVPDGSEFPFLPILTDSQGEFTHEVDTLLLSVGTHELWVVDDTTSVSSNIARFEVTRDQPPAR